MLPGSFLYTNTGMELIHLQSMSDIASPPVLISLGLLAVSPYLLARIKKYLA